MELERNDIQGLIVSSYRQLPCAAYVLLRVKNAPAARAWLSRKVGEITTAEGKQPHVSTNLAFTSVGLSNLGLTQNTLATFSRPFQEGMATIHRSRILGDNKENAPSNWEWGGRADNLVDLLLLIFGSDEEVLKTHLQQSQQELTASGGFEDPKVLQARETARQPRAFWL